MNPELMTDDYEDFCDYDDVVRYNDDPLSIDYDVTSDPEFHSAFGLDEEVKL